MAVVFVMYWWVVPASGRRIFLLAVSLAYFTYSYPPYALLLGALTLAVWGLGNAIFLLRSDTESSHPVRGQRAKIGLIAGLMLCVGTLILFKYTRMFVGAWNGIVPVFLHYAHEIGFAWNAPQHELRPPDLLVPLGISFFTFEFIHYLVDLYLGKVAQRASLLDFGLFAFFFPSLVSGPVKRFQLFQQQTEEVDTFQAAYLNEGLRRIILGAAKKLIVADTADLLTKPLIHPLSYSGHALYWVAMHAYAIKIYYDFSGYTDIAIGCAQLLGYRLPENFNRPYRQPNLQKFWNNWHMSLSSWIRDYLYIPLGGSRVSKTRVLFNLTLVMAICGLWHGANWNFLVWGLWNGLGLAALQIFHRMRTLPDTRPVRWLSTALTFQFVCFGWVFFAAPDLPTALLTMQRLLPGH